MKKITSIALVFLMSLQCIYQLGVITYFHVNREYVAEVLCINKEEPITMCYGQCFLKKNLDLADQSAKDQSTAPVGKQEVDFPVFLISENLNPIACVVKSQESNYHYISGLSSKHSSAPFHPPAFSS